MEPNQMQPVPPQQGGMTPQQGAMIAQLGGVVQALLSRVKPLFDQPVIRMPYNLPLARSQVIGAGLSGQPLVQTDFIHALEWPFEVHKIKFSQDPSHTFRDWRVAIQDQTFNQPFQKSSVMVATLIDDNTGAWDLKFPWVARPKGGGFNVVVDNLDEDNPITVDINFIGFMLIPRT